MDRGDPDLVAGGGGGEIQEDLEVASPSDEALEDRVQEAAVPKAARDPGQPSKADREMHKLTHCPYRSWCEHCVRGQAVGQPHRSVPEELAKSDVPRVIIDYAFLQEDMTKEVEAEEGKKEDDAEVEGVRASMKIVVMTETECNSI